MFVGSWIMLLVLVGGGILVLGGLATVVALLANKRTRTAGILLIAGVLALSVFVAVVGMLFWGRSGHERQATAEHINQYLAMQAEQLSRDAERRHLEAQAAALEVYEATQRDVAKPMTLPVGSTPEVVSETVVAEETPAEETTAEESPAEETPEAAAETTEGDSHTDAVASESPAETPAAPVEAAAPARPAWVDAEPGTVDGAYQVVVEVGPYKTAEGCDLEQPAKLRIALIQYVHRFINPAAVSHVRFTPTLYEQVVKETWEETGEFTVGPMLHRYLLLRFDNKAMRMIEDQHRQVIVQQRVWYTGLGLTGIVLLLGVAFTVLRIDLALDGKYRIRMVFLTMLALGLLAFVALIGVRFLGISRFAPQPVQATAAKVMPVSMNSFTVTIPAADVAQAQVAQATSATPRKSVMAVGVLVLALGAGFVVLLLIMAVVASRKRHKRRFEGAGVSGNMDP